MRQLAATLSAVLGQSSTAGVVPLGERDWNLPGTGGHLGPIETGLVERASGVELYLTVPRGFLSAGGVADRVRNRLVQEASFRGELHFASGSSLQAWLVATWFPDGEPPFLRLPTGRSSRQLARLADQGISQAESWESAFYPARERYAADLTRERSRGRVRAVMRGLRPGHMPHLVAVSRIDEFGSVDGAPLGSFRGCATEAEAEVVAGWLRGPAGQEFIQDTLAFHGSQRWPSGRWEVRTWAQKLLVLATDEAVAAVEYLGGVDPAAVAEDETDPYFDPTVVGESAARAAVEAMVWS